MKQVLGLPRMNKEAGELRDFLPAVAQCALCAGWGVQIERGLGSGMGLTDAAYTALSSQVRVGTAADAWSCPLVLVLRSPEVEEYEGLLRRGGALMAMLHFPTRPRRVAKLRELQVCGISLDSLADDTGARLVEYTAAVGWNGVEAAFTALERFAPWRLGRDQEPVRVLVLGSGRVGRHAVDAATKYGSRARASKWSAEGRPPVEVTVIGRLLMGREAYVRGLMARADVLVDASQREDSSTPLVPNGWLSGLPAHAVICDLVVDPYVLNGTPPTVRSIEGIPRGDLDQFIYAVDDAGWSKTVPPSIPQAVRRTAVTCYSWPGVHPLECMERYGRQLAPLLTRLLEVGGPSGLRADGDALDRALWRASSLSLG